MENSNAQASRRPSCCCGPSAAYTAGSKIDWQPWSDSVFERAARENRFVLLDLEAVWCHWCHVMDDVTYSDPKVVELIKARYIPRARRPGLAA